jgi:hypothetical protein
MRAKETLLISTFPRFSGQRGGKGARVSLILRVFAGKKLTRQIPARITPPFLPTQPVAGKIAA